MKYLNKQARAVMDKLTEGLNGGHGRLITVVVNPSWPVHVEQINQTPLGPVFSVTHYYKQNGDLMRDPDMTFLRGITGE